MQKSRGIYITIIAISRHEMQAVHRQTFRRTFQLAVIAFWKTFPLLLELTTWADARCNDNVTFSESYFRK